MGETTHQTAQINSKNGQEDHADVGSFRWEKLHIKPHRQTAEMDKNDDKIK